MVSGRRKRKRRRGSIREAEREEEEKEEANTLAFLLIIKIWTLKYPKEQI